MNIIGFNGFKRSGKGEATLAVERILNNREVKGVGFADKLKVLAARSLGFLDLTEQECIALMDEAKESWRLEMWQLNNALMDPYSPGYPIGQVTNKITGRQYLQHMGTQARNIFGADFWVDQVLPDPAQYDAEDKSDRYDELLEARYPAVDVLCLTDLRFENEAERIKALGGINIEILRPGTGSDGHDSEQRLPAGLVDYQIVNDRTLDDLENEIDGVLFEAGIL